MRFNASAKMYLATITYGMICKTEMDSRVITDWIASQISVKPDLTVFYRRAGFNLQVSVRSEDFYSLPDITKKVENYLGKVGLPLYNRLEILQELGT